LTTSAEGEKAVPPDTESLDGLLLACHPAC
jgi:hypothetical protein